MASERLGRVSVTVDPDFDQAELFRQVRAAAKKIPALDLKVRITAKSVNEAIREVNKKKLIKLNVDVAIKVTSVNKAIREVNAKKLVALTPPVRLNVREVNRAITAVNRRKLRAIEVDLKIKEVVKTTRDIEKLNKTFKKTTGGLKGFAANIVILRSAFGLVRISAFATAIGFLAQVLASATTAVVTLTSALVPGLIGGLAAGAVGATAFAQALGVLTFSMEGVGKALKGLNENIDPKKLAALTPAARSFVIELDKMKAPLRGLQQTLQENLFSRLTDSLENLSPLLNQVAPGLQQTATILGDIALNASEVASTMGGDFQRIISTNNVLIQNFGESVTLLSETLVDLLVAAGPLAIVISETSKNTALLINQFVQAKRESGELASFFRIAGESLFDIGRIARDLGATITNIFKAALPTGQAFLDLLQEATADLRELTGSKKGQKNIAAFFEESLPILKEFGGLIVDLGQAFIRLSHQPEFFVLVETIRSSLLPRLEETITKLTGEFGPVLVETLTSMAGLFAVLAGEAGPLNLLVEVVGNVAEAVARFAEQHPNITKLAAAFFVLESALSIIALQRFLFAASGLGLVFRTLLPYLIGTASITAGFSALAGSIGVAAGAVSVFVAAVAPFVLAIGAVAIGFKLAWENSKLFREACQTVSDAAVAIIPGLGAAGAAVSNFVLQMQGIGQTIDRDTLSPLTRGIADFRAQHPEATAKELHKEYLRLGGVAHKAGKGQKSLNDETLTFEERLQKAREESRKFFDTSLKDFKELQNVAVPAMEDIKAAGQSTSDVLKDRLQNSVDGMRAKSDLLSDALEKQKSKVDGLKDSIEALKNVQLEGTKAFDDTRFALDQQAKALELQQVELKLAGVASDDPRFKGLEDQLEQIRLQAQKTDLTESLQLDPLRRKLDETFNPIKELSFTGALSEFQKLTAQHVDETKKLDGLQKKYDGLNDAIKKVERTISGISRSTSGLASGLSQAVSAPEIIQKPLQAANQSLKVSKTKIEQNIGGVREGLRKPFRQAAGDINRILSALPQTAGRGATTAIVWAFDTGENMGIALIRGMMRGMRSFLVEGSDLHKLLNKEIPDFIRANKGPIATDRQILVPAGVAIMEGLTTGLRRGFDPVKSYLKDVGPSMQEYVPDSMFSKRTAEFMVEVAAGNKPDPRKFFGDLVPDFPPIDFETGGLTGANPFKAIEALFGLRRSSGDNDAPGVHAANSYHYRKAPWGGVQAYDYGDALNSTATLLKVAAFARRHAGLFAEAFYDKFQSYVKNGQVIQGVFGGHGDHVHLAFKSAISDALGGAVGGPKTPFDGIFQAAAAAFHLPASLLKAVAKAESGFNPKAGSGAGAQGLMQLLPSTFLAQHVGGNIFDPKQNIFAGAKYLSAQLKKFKSIRLALAAYNAGPGAVGSFGGVPPFAETIAYIARVLAFLKDFGGFRAMGGPTVPGQWNIVGENGPEVHVSRRPGFVISNDRLDRMITALENMDRASGGDTNINVQTASQDPRVLMELLEAKDRRRRARMKL